MIQTNRSNRVWNVHKLMLELVFLGHKLPKRPNAITLSGMMAGGDKMYPQLIGLVNGLF